MVTKSRDLYKMEDTMQGDFSGAFKISYCILFLGGLLLRDSNVDKKCDIES